MSLPESGYAAEKEACRNGGSLNKELGARIVSLDEYPDT